nr:hypothetical protein [Candidatus Freyarchaeota archaeon]
MSENKGLFYSLEKHHHQSKTVGMRAIHFYVEKQSLCKKARLYSGMKRIDTPENYLP